MPSLMELFREQDAFVDMIKRAGGRRGGSEANRLLPPNMGWNEIGRAHV